MFNIQTTICFNILFILLYNLQYCGQLHPSSSLHAPEASKALLRKIDKGISHGDSTYENVFFKEQIKFALLSS